MILPSQDAVPAFFSQLHAEIRSEDNTIYQAFLSMGFETESLPHNDGDCVEAR